MLPLTRGPLMLEEELDKRSYMPVSTALCVIYAFFLFNGIR